MRRLFRLFRRRKGPGAGHSIPVNNRKKPSCDCTEERGHIVIQATGVTYEQLLDAYQICYDSQREVTEHAIMTLICGVTIRGTHIDPYSVEAIWEANAFIVGIEQRLIAHLDAFAERIKKLTPEDREKIQAFSEKLHNSIQIGE